MITMEQQNVYEDLEASHPANQSHSLQPCTRMEKHINEVMTVQEDGDELISGSNKTESNRHMKDSNSDLMLNLLPKPDPSFVKHLHDQKFEKEAEETRAFHDPLAHLSNKSSRRKLERKLVFDSDIPQQKNVVLKPNAPNGNRGDEILQISRIVSPSESDMITMTSRITMDQNDRLTHSLSNMSEPSLFMEAKNRMLERWNTGLVHYQGSVEKDEGSWLGDVNIDMASADAVTSCEIEVSSESVSMLNLKLSSCIVEDINFSEADEHRSKCSQKNIDHKICVWTCIRIFWMLSRMNTACQSSPTDVPPSEDVLYGPHFFVKLDPRLKVSDSVSLETSFMTHILKTSENYDCDLDTFSSSWQTIHHPKDPRSEEGLLYDYIEETFFRTSKSMVAYPWVNPGKRESQITLNKIKTEDQMLKVINEIEKEDAEEFIALSYEKDPEWLHQTNEIDILGLAYELQKYYSRPLDCEAAQMVIENQRIVNVHSFVYKHFAAKRGVHALILQAPGPSRKRSRSPSSPFFPDAITFSDGKPTSETSELNPEDVTARLEDLEVEVDTLHADTEDKELLIFELQDSLAAAENEFAILQIRVADTED
ncbi:hypothetical protein Tco_0708507 [Tanacetum coccineum]